MAPHAVAGRGTDRRNDFRGPDERVRGPAQRDARGRILRARNCLPRRRCRHPDRNVRDPWSFGGYRDSQHSCPGSPDGTARGCPVGRGHVAGGRAHDGRLDARGGGCPSGTPTAAGTAGFTLDVIDTAGATLTKTYSLTVNPALVIAPAALAEATPGTATSQTITVSDGSKPYTTFTISGLRCGTTGLTAANLARRHGGNCDAERHTDSGRDGKLHGGRHRYGGGDPQQVYTLTVNPVVVITPAALAEATAGTATSQTITVSDGAKPYTTFSISGLQWRDDTG